jgi:hypothetical protein
MSIICQCREEGEHDLDILWTGTVVLLSNWQLLERDRFHRSSGGEYLASRLISNCVCMSVISNETFPFGRFGWWFLSSTSCQCPENFCAKVPTVLVQSASAYFQFEESWCQQYCPSITALKVSNTRLVVSAIDDIPVKVNKSQHLAGGRRSPSSWRCKESSTGEKSTISRKAFGLPISWYKGCPRGWRWIAKIRMNSLSHIHGRTAGVEKINKTILSVRRCAPNFCHDVGETSELTTNARRVASALRVHRAHTERM